jgi:hypothetical protein
VVGGAEGAYDAHLMSQPLPDDDDFTWTDHAESSGDEDRSPSRDARRVVVVLLLAGVLLVVLVAVLAHILFGIFGDMSNDVFVF